MIGSVFQILQFEACKDCLSSIIIHILCSCGGKLTNVIVQFENQTSLAYIQMGEESNQTSLAHIQMGEDSTSLANIHVVLGRLKVASVSLCISSKFTFLGSTRRFSSSDLNE